MGSAQVGVWQDQARAAIIVAHPGDEVLHAGGTILTRHDLRWHVVTLCGANDMNRGMQFLSALDALEATGAMGDLDDKMVSIRKNLIDELLEKLLPQDRYRVVITHGLTGGDQRNALHEEICRGVIRMWSTGRLETEVLWLLANEKLQRCGNEEHWVPTYQDWVYWEKQRIMTELYGFEPDSWAVHAISKIEPFYCFDTPQEARAWIDGNEH